LLFIAAKELNTSASISPSVCTDSTFVIT
jgi:hypothetical protein